MTVIVNDRIRETVFVALRRRKMTQRELARQAGLSSAYVSRILSGYVEGGREAWEAIFEVLGFELAIVPKDTDVNTYLEKGA